MALNCCFAGNRSFVVCCDKCQRSNRFTLFVSMCLSFIRVRRLEVTLLSSSHFSNEMREKMFFKQKCKIMLLIEQKSKNKYQHFKLFQSSLPYLLLLHANICILTSTMCWDYRRNLARDANVEKILTRSLVDISIMLKTTN